MKTDRSSLSRRSVMAGAGLGALMAPAAALAQSSAQGVQKAFARTSASGKVWSNEYWAQKGDVKLYMFRKRATAPKAGAAALPVLLLVHGSSNSGRVSFDLATPGRGEYSVMNEFSRLGFDTWTLDHENYGRSSQTQSNSDIASGVEDLKAAVELIARE